MSCLVSEGLRMISYVRSSALNNWAVTWDVRQTKTQISLRVRAAWYESSLSTWRNCILGYPKCAQWILIRLRPVKTDQTGWSESSLGARVRRNAFWRCGSLYKIASHDKTYNKTCVTGEDSVQPVYPPSTAMLPVYPSLDSPEGVEGTCDQQRLIRLRGCAGWSDLSLRCSHKSYCSFACGRFMPLAKWTHKISADENLQQKSSNLPFLGRMLWYELINFISKAGSFPTDQEWRRSTLTTCVNCSTKRLNVTKIFFRLNCKHTLLRRLKEQTLKRSMSQFMVRRPEWLPLKLLETGCCIG